jgi:hypothetical protein
MGFHATYHGLGVNHVGIRPGRQTPSVTVSLHADRAERTAIVATPNNKARRRKLGNLVLFMLVPPSPIVQTSSIGCGKKADDDC